MLIVLPSTPTTEKASEYLSQQGIAHQVIPIPESLGYKTGADIAIYAEQDLSMTLTKARFVVMRVFREFKLD